MTVARAAKGDGRSGPAPGTRARRLLVLGASGKCGRHVVRLAVARGHAVTAIVRPGTRYAEVPGTRLERRDVLAAGALDRLVAGHDAVVSCLGIQRAHPWSPWSRVTSPRDLTQRVSAGLVSAMNREGVPRLIAISAAGVGDSVARTNAVMRWVIRHSNVGASYRDLEAMETALRDSTLDWMAVRAATLTGGGPSGRVHRVERYGIATRVRRGDVATWILDRVVDPSPFEMRTPMIATAG